jgi:drug/metabolite transporter (DMT)-like permease
VDLIFLVPLLFSFHQIFIRKGGEEVDTLSGTYLSLLTCTLLFSPSIFFAELRTHFLFLMVVAGLFHFFVARLCFYYAIERIGANLSSPLSATRIYFAAIIGYLAGEEITLKLILMTLLVFMGITLLSKPEGVKVDLIGIALGLLTGFFSALSSFFVRVGMLEVYNPLFGAFVGFAASTLLLTPFAIKRGLKPKKGRFFVLGGLFVGIGHLIRYISLHDLPVSVVEPVVSIYPLFTIILSYFFLKEREVFGIRMCAGALLIILGVNVYFL